MKQRDRRDIKYKLGYSNLTFELWMILHKADCSSPLNFRYHYLNPINRAFQENFSRIEEFKRERNFKRLLGELSLAHVWDAIERADRIMQRNVENGYAIQQYCGYEYYRVNPSLSIGKVVKNIFAECKVLRELV